MSLFITYLLKATHVLQLDQRNRGLQAEMQINVKARDAADAECVHLLDFLAEVRSTNCPLCSILILATGPREVG